ncbi:MAG TPA: DUF1800 family protein [Rudaea sp.]|jgi:uncharacterized protein (DUF1800 family)|nr:DUF1800 family protein [Rudaea sp.]
MAAVSLSRGPDPLFHDNLEGITIGPFNDSDASRFLAQATFGPTDADIAHLRSVGYQAWLNEQFAAAPTYEMNYLNWVGSTLQEQLGQDDRQEAWFLGALGGPDPQNNALIHSDQLRQRVAFALSEIFVVSDNNTTLDNSALGMGYYYDILIRDAFGNYRQLLQDVTLSPAMGVYLNMMGNRRADLSQNLHPDENYGREINQLFSIGLAMMNTDGTLQLSGGQPISTYTQSTITNFAHVFTGWNWSDCDADDMGHQFANDSFSYCGPDESNSNYLTSIIPFDTTIPLYPDNSPSYHDNGTDATNDVSDKQLLSYPGAVNGGVLANGGTAASDLQFALDNISNHPNVGPFIAKQLIQHLVTSNPSSAYVQRVAAVFNNDGSGARGNLKAVVKQILLDPEARIGQWQNADTFGKLREPLLTLTHYWRAMGAQHKCGLNISASGTPGMDGYTYPSNYGGQPYRYAGYSTAWSTGATTSYGVGVDQASLDALTVFNFFKPGYLPPGEMTTRNLLGPEFQIATDSIVAGSNNTFASNALYGNFDLSDTCDSDDTFGDVRVNHAQDVALAGTGNGKGTDTSDRLVDEYSKRFMSGQMSPYMRDQLVTYLNKINSSWVSDGSDWRLQRVDRALYLVLTSPEYMIQK